MDLDFFFQNMKISAIVRLRCFVAVAILFDEVHGQIQQTKLKKRLKSVLLDIETNFKKIESSKLKQIEKGTFVCILQFFICLQKRI